MDPFRITRLEIKNIGPFGQLELEFPKKPSEFENKAEIHILTGENGTGKTTILEALVKSVGSNMSPIFSERWRNYGSIEEHDPFFGSSSTNKNNPTARLEVNFSRGNHFSISRSKDGSFSVNSDNFVLQELQQHTEDSIYKVACFAYSGYRIINQFKISEIREITGHPLNSALDFHSSINPELILRWIASNLTKEALANSQSDSVSSKKFRDAISNIELSLERILNTEIKFALQYTPVLDVQIMIGGEILNFNILPDGLKSIISWISDLLIRLERLRWTNDTTIFERNFILFLDEIEVHMHPAWQRKILPVIQDLFPNAQIFVSTHSPFVVGSVDGAWIHKLEKPNGDSRLAAGYPMVSEDAKSFRYWLYEVFDIKEEFGTEVERDMGEFYQLRDRVLKGENGQTPEKLMEAARKLAVQSTEVNQIIQMEIRQINRQKGLQLSL